MHTQPSKSIFFVLEGLNALAASYFNCYVFFLLRDRFDFGNLGNLSASALGGLVYVVAAWQGGRFAQRFGCYAALKVGWGCLAVCMALGTLVSSLPAILLVLVAWTAAVCFTWPALEALVSDGVDEAVLPRNIGIYNVVWAGASASTYFCGGMLYESLGQGSIFWLPALIHAGQWLTVLCLRKLPAHSEVPLPAVEPHPGEAVALAPTVSAETFLRMVWLAIPFSYIGITTVTAVIPALASTLGLSTAQAGLFCSVWMFVRLGTFGALWQWTGWHYRFRPLVAAFVGLIVGFGLLLVSTDLGLLLVAQGIFGVSIGLIYYSSLFYSMDVGGTKGEHGGFHEAMIGAGMCLGPAVGALSLCVAPAFPHASVCTVTALLTCGLVGLIGLRVRHAG